MKYATFSLITALILSCSSTKTIVKSSYNETAKVEITQPEEPVEIPEINSTEIENKTVKTISVEKQKPVKIEEVLVENFNHNSWNALLIKYVSNNGHVNYNGFKTDRKTLTKYLSLLSENTPNDSWSKDEKLTYWINAYNAMTIDLIVRNYPIKSIKDINKPWEQRLWKLGDKWYNLEDIEHKILRKMNEPRIHFTIVCASFSCPKLLNEAYTASKLETQLIHATKDFLSDSNRNNITKDRIKISKIFQWFSSDFKQNGSLIDFLNQYSEVTISSIAKTSFKDYNWALNE